MWPVVLLCSSISSHSLTSRFLSFLLFFYNTTLRPFNIIPLFCSSSSSILSSSRPLLSCLCAFSSWSSSSSLQLSPKTSSAPSLLQSFSNCCCRFITHLPALYDCYYYYYCPPSLSAILHLKSVLQLYNTWGRNLSAQSSTKTLSFVFLKPTHLTIIAVTIDMCWAEQVVNSTRILIKPRVLTLLTTSCCQKKRDTECPHSSVLTFPCRGLIL